MLVVGAERRKGGLFAECPVRVLPAGCATKNRIGKKLAGSRPNIVFILSDDMGWAEPGFNGGNPELTPNIDRLASDGLNRKQKRS